MLGIAEAAQAGYFGSIRECSSKYSGAKLFELHSTQIRLGNVGGWIDVARRTMLAI
jgi:hypothetical protein